MGKSVTAENRLGQICCDKKHKQSNLLFAGREVAHCVQLGCGQLFDGPSRRTRVALFENMSPLGLNALLRHGDTLLVSAGAGEPKELINELCTVAQQTDLELQVIQVMTGGSEMLADASGQGLRLHTPVPGAKSRRAIADGRADLLQSSMSGLLRAILNRTQRIDGVLMLGRAEGKKRATPGLIADVMVPAWERARFRALELNDKLPRIPSQLLDINAAHYVLNTSYEPPELHSDSASAEAYTIGKFIAEIIPDGATIELGIGRALAGVTAALLHNHRNLAMHTGIVGDSAMQLIESGCVSRPIRGEAMAVGATAMGSRQYYSWVDRNRYVCLVDSRLAHQADVLSANPKFCAINSGIEVDLSGNVNSIVHRGRTIGGIGGGADFARGGAQGAASIIGLFATRHDGTSTIVGKAQGVSVPGQDVTHVVTEYGIAGIRGLRGKDRARVIASVAAPEHRQELIQFSST